MKAGRAYCAFSAGPRRRNRPAVVPHVSGPAACSWRNEVASRAGDITVSRGSHRATGAECASADSHPRPRCPGEDALRRAWTRVGFHLAPFDGTWVHARGPRRAGGSRVAPGTSTPRDETSRSRPKAELPACPTEPSLARPDSGDECRQNLTLHADLARPVGMRPVRVTLSITRARSLPAGHTENAGDRPSRRPGGEAAIPSTFLPSTEGRPRPDHPIPGGFFGS